MDLDFRPPKGQNKDADDELIEELAGSQKEAALNAATAQIDQGVRWNVTDLLSHTHSRRRKSRTSLTLPESMGGKIAG